MSDGDGGADALACAPERQPIVFAKAVRDGFDEPHYFPYSTDHHALRRKPPKCAIKRD